MEALEDAGVTGIPQHALVEGEYLLSFWIRPYDGWTRRLRDLYLKSRFPFRASLGFRETILLEGPYGRAEPLWAFDEVLLIAGGSGIAALVPYVLDHVARASASDDKPMLTRTRAVTLVWTNRKEALIRQVTENELATALQRDDLTAAFYCTGCSAEGQITLPTSSSTYAVPKGDAPKDTSVGGVLVEKDETDVSELTDGMSGAGVVAIRAGRPDITSMIEMAAISATKSGSRLAVMSCGPSGMADAAREAAYGVMHQSGGAIKYFEEAFGW